VIVGDAKVQRQKRAIGGNTVRKHDAESKRSHFLYAMIRRKSLHPAFSFWNVTPDPTPVQSPVASDCDTDDEGNMARWQPSRPLSLAIPSGNHSASRPTLDDVLANNAGPPYTLSAFMAYLSQNHCLETLEFTLDSKRYRESYCAVARQLDEYPILTDSSQTEHLRMLWRRLISAYIVPGAPREINLSSEVRDALLGHSRSPAPPPPETLDSAVRRIHDLMDESIFLPFLNSYSSPPVPHPPYGDLSEGILRTRTNPSAEEGQVRRHTSIRQRLSPQSSRLDFVTSRSPPSSYSSPSSTSATYAMSAQGRIGTLVSSYGSAASADSGSANLTDDSGSMASSPGTGEPMTPPTTPPSSDIFGTGQSPKGRSDNAWKKMGMKLGWKKRSGGSPGGPAFGDARFPATEEE
jgi:hypothetical protein